LYAGKFRVGFRLCLRQPLLLSESGNPLGFRVGSGLFIRLTLLLGDGDATARRPYLAFNRFRFLFSAFNISVFQNGPWSVVHPLPSVLWLKLSWQRHALSLYSVPR